jgi:hypothetical protein
MVMVQCPLMSLLIGSEGLVRALHSIGKDWLRRRSTLHREQQQGRNKPQQRQQQQSHAQAFRLHDHEPTTADYPPLPDKELRLHQHVLACLHLHHPLYGKAVLRSHKIL